MDLLYLGKLNFIVMKNNEVDMLIFDSAVLQRRSNEEVLNEGVLNNENIIQGDAKIIKIDGSRLIIPNKFYSWPIFVSSARKNSAE